MAQGATSLKKFLPITSPGVPPDIADSPALNLRILPERSTRIAPKGSRSGRDGSWATRLSTLSPPNVINSISLCAVSLRGWVPDRLPSSLRCVEPEQEFADQTAIAANHVVGLLPQRGGAQGDLGAADAPIRRIDPDR